MTRAPTIRADAPPADQAARLRSLVSAAPARTRAGDHPRRSAPVPQGPARVLAIASGKGGVGKSTLAVNLSIALASHSMRTTLLDADMGTANADVLCGISPRRRLDGWLDKARQRAAPSIDGLAVDAPGGFRLVPGVVGLARALDGEQRLALAQGIDELERHSDVLVLDAAAGVGRQVVTMLEMADVSIIVTTPEPTAIADAYALIKCVTSGRAVRGSIRARRHGIGPRGARLALVVNQAQETREALDVHRRINAVAERFLGVRVALLGTVAFDPLVGAAVRAKRPLLCADTRSPAARDIRSIGDALAQLLRPGELPAVRPARRVSDVVGVRRHEWSTNVRRRNE